VQSLVVFDLDGTLVDSRTDLVVSANEMLKSFGASALDEAAVASFVGDGAKMLVARSLKAAGLPPASLGDALAKFLEIYSGRLVETTRPYDGITDIVARAADDGVRLGVLTNKPIGPTFTILNHFNLARHFTWVIGGDGEFPRKPDPAGLQWIIGDAGGERSRTLFVGDSQVDADTARAAQTRFCLAAYGFGQARGIVSLRHGEFYARSARDVGAVVATI
jgi:phosphoglycolate phosphatase